MDDFRASSKIIADNMDSAYKSEVQGIIIGIVDLQEASLARLMRTIMTALVQEIASVIDPRIWDAKPGFTILITTSETAKLLTSLIIRLSSQPMTTVGTLAEALMVVSYMYPELQPLLDAHADAEQPAENRK